MNSARKVAASRPAGFTISRRSALAGLAASVAAPAMTAGSSLAADEGRDDPWLLLAEEHLALSAAVYDCDEAEDGFSELADRCWERTEAIEMQIGHSQPRTVAGAMAWLRLLQADECDFGNLTGVYDGTRIAIARAGLDGLLRLSKASDRKAVAPVFAALGEAKPTAPPDPGDDPWLVLAHRHVAACSEAKASWVDGDLPDAIADDCWRRCREAIEGLQDAAGAGAAGVAAWLRLYSLPEAHDHAPFVPAAVPLVIEQAMTMLCALSTEAAVAVARLEIELARTPAQRVAS